VIGQADLIVAHPLALFAYRYAPIDTPVVTLQLFPCLIDDEWRAVQARKGLAWDQMLRRLDLFASSFDNTSIRDLWGRRQIVTLEHGVAEGRGIEGKRVAYPLSRDDRAELPGVVAEFVHSKRGPLIICCQGTLLANTRYRVNTFVEKAARRLGARVLVLGTAGRESKSDQWVMYRSFVPLHKVLPYCATVVHHAGAGTTRAVLYTGKPAIAIPGPFDTQWTAEAFAGIGLVRVVNENDLYSHGKLEEVILEQLESDPKIERSFSNNLSDGAKDIASYIERILQ
jgi:hypothetical protein